MSLAIWVKGDFDVILSDGCASSVRKGKEKERQRHRLAEDLLFDAVARRVVQGLNVGQVGVVRAFGAAQPLALFGHLQVHARRRFDLGQQRRILPVVGLFAVPFRVLPVYPYRLVSFVFSQIG